MSVTNRKVQRHCETPDPKCTAICRREWVVFPIRVPAWSWEIRS